jgi:hypothetical protein
MLTGLTIDDPFARHGIETDAEEDPRAVTQLPDTFLDSDAPSLRSVEFKCCLVKLPLAIMKNLLVLHLEKFDVSVKEIFECLQASPQLQTLILLFKARPNKSYLKELPSVTLDALKLCSIGYLRPEDHVWLQQLFKSLNLSSQAECFLWTPTDSVQDFILRPLTSAGLQTELFTREELILTVGPYAEDHGGWGPRVTVKAATMQMDIALQLYVNRLIPGGLRTFMSAIPDDTCLSNIKILDIEGDEFLAGLRAEDWSRLGGMFPEVEKLRLTGANEVSKTVMNLVAASHEENPIFAKLKCICLEQSRCFDTFIPIDFFTTRRQTLEVPLEQIKFTGPPWSDANDCSREWEAFRKRHSDIDMTMDVSYDIETSYHLSTFMMSWPPPGFEERYTCD